MNKIVNDETKINTKTFDKYFKYQNPTSLLKDLYEVDKATIEKIVDHVNVALRDLRNAVNKKDIPENENLDKVIDIVEEILSFNKPQNGKGIKILKPKPMLQRLPIALAQEKAHNTSENLSDEICQIIFSLY